jgi:hypothetical protein
MDGLPELVDVILLAESVAPQYTRVKELIESVEAFKLVVAFLSTAENHREVGGLYKLNAVDT